MGRPLSASTIVDRVAEEIPRAGLAHLVAVIEELKRRAKAGKTAPRELNIVLELDEQTGTVLAVKVWRRYDWSDG